MILGTIDLSLLSSLVFQKGPKLEDFVLNYLMIDAMIALMHSHKKVIVSGHVIIIILEAITKIKLAIAYSTYMYDITDF